MFDTIVGAWSVRYATAGCYFMYDDSKDGNYDGDDDCGHALIPLSYYPSLISSSTDEHAHLSHVEYIPTIAGWIRSLERGTTPLLGDPWDASPLTHGGPQCVQS